MKKHLFFAKVARYNSTKGKGPDSRHSDRSGPEVRSVLPRGLIVIGGALLLLAGIFLFFDAGRTGYGPHAVIRTSLDALETVTADSQPLGLDTTYPLLLTGLKSGRAGGGGVVRGEVGFDDHSGLYAFHGDDSSGGAAGLLRFVHGAVSIETADGPVPVYRLRRTSPVAVSRQDLFEKDYFCGERGGVLVGASGGKKGGVYLGWASGAAPAPGGALLCQPEADRAAALVRALARGLSVPGNEGAYSANAGRYKAHVRRYAEQYGLTTALVLAIMHTESNFNPFAVSPSMAVGLMQIVPDTAGHEAHQYLTGSFSAPSLDLLFSPEHNIRYGTTYLHLLARRYFGGVHNSRSRQMCMIAAYNGGPGAVLRLFDPYDQDAAVARINAMSPDQIYAALTRDMPNAETRRYVELVLDRMRSYGL
ncbi:transglycosylase SLT domain-containing protein [Desulfovibrio sp. OttesenSCG-928-F20]|nr:transglycosylase SLT domain-containing protein [Desulfovibrio sp. OttesenSCG-928-F20]